MKKITLIVAVLLAACGAFAQSNPGLQYGQVPTAGQWNSYFAGKLDYNVNGLPIQYGGTGSTTASGALRNIFGYPATSGYYMRGTGTTWAASAIQAADVPTLNQNTTGTAGGLSGGTIGAVPYQSGAGATSFLSGNTSTTPQFVTSTGTGAAAQAPTLTSSTGSGSVVLSTSPSITSATISTINGNTLTTGTGTLTLGSKTLTASNSLTLAGTDGTTMTFPSTSATIARTDGSQTFTGTQTFSGTVAGTALSNYLASPAAIGGTAAAAGSFTTLSASGTVSGTGFVNMQASPNPIGSTTPNTGAFTTLSASSTVSGTGFSTYLASPPAIGGTAAAAGSFTTLSASSTVSGTGFSTYLASPPAIGGTAANTVKATTLTVTSGVNTGNLLVSTTAPTLSSCSTGGTPTVTANGTAAFRVNLSSQVSACTITMPAAATGWNCYATNVTTTANAWMLKQTASTTTSVTLTNYNGGVATNMNTTDVLAVSCFAY